ncbi:unnamed protein product [Parnassius apollo]|uniref:(apollo) hypothetical protein n=1 Tax=Parnassius apollo TaxID=110799 RepID=A0A8S3XH38_PARAO|nr:unnamed protein product [Parnassius apollo]
MTSSRYFSNTVSCEDSLSAEVPCIGEVDLSSTCGCDDCGAILGAGEFGEVGDREPASGEPSHDKNLLQVTIIFEI